MLLLALLLLRVADPPPGMIAIPAGELVRGKDQSLRSDETPRHRVRLSAFFIDAALTTNADFRNFVEKTGHATSAEKLGFGMIAVEGMDDWKWEKVQGATWRRPFARDPKAPSPKDDEPVVLMSWYDADAYCRFAKKRLPTEAELEYAARAGRFDTRFPWGDSPYLPDGRPGLNFWQGKSHRENTRNDGFLYVSPVHAFPPNAWGLYDAAGNVWQWTSDWYGERYYRELASAAEPALDPKGPSAGTKKVSRGGSWWCSKETCSGYGLFYRGKNEPDAPFNNNGFRCAKDRQKR